eukprot:1710539-Prymnesium_polylepis.1
MEELKEAHAQVEEAMPLASAAARERAENAAREVAALESEASSADGALAGSSASALLQEARGELKVATVGQQVLALELDCLRGAVDEQRERVDEHRQEE